MEDEGETYLKKNVDFLAFLRINFWHYSVTSQDWIEIIIVSEIELNLVDEVVF